MQQRQRNEMKIAHCTRERENFSVINRRRRSEEIDAHLMNRLTMERRGASFPFPRFRKGIILGMNHRIGANSHWLNSRRAKSKSEGCSAQLMPSQTRLLWSLLPLLPQSSNECKRLKFACLEDRFAAGRKRLQPRLVAMPLPPLSPKMG